MIRLFVAARPPQSVRHYLRSLMHGVEGARWQDDAQLHLTLKFIGEVDDNRAIDIVDALRGVHAPSLEVRIDGTGFFARKGRLDCLWAGTAPAEGLEQLHRKIDRALVRCGLPPEGRAFRPHVTLARFGKQQGSAAAFLENCAAASSPPFMIDAFALFESLLSRSGSHYRVIECFTLDKV
jgi:2'-5' RNA ligase